MRPPLPPDDAQEDQLGFQGGLPRGESQKESVGEKGREFQAEAGRKKVVGSRNRKKLSPTVTSSLTPTIPFGAQCPLGRSEDQSSYSQFTDRKTSPKRERDQAPLGLEPASPGSQLR